MNFIDDCYYSVEVSITIIILIVLIIPMMIVCKKKIVVYQTIALLLIFTVLFLIPIKDSRREQFPNKIIDGSWITVHETKDPLYYKKIWKNASEYIPVSEKIGLNFLGKDRCVFDLIAWKFCMAAQWETIQYCKKYKNQIDSIVNVRNINEEELSYEQEICRYPSRDDHHIIMKQFRKINEQLRDHGLYYIDIHSKNVMIDSNGNVKFIDGELLSESNFRIACFIYKNIVRPPLVMVSNFDRIYWSRENEETVPPLDSYDHNGELIRSPYK